MDQAKIDRLIRMEWDMFSAVNEGGPRASCQEDPDTFYGMRNAQFRSWDDATLDSYFEDVEAAAAAEKFIDGAQLAHMETVTIIHGKGTGAVRAAVHDVLRRSKQVKSFRLGRYGEGEDGVTVVTMK